MTEERPSWAAFAWLGVFFGVALGALGVSLFWRARGGALAGGKKTKMLSSSSSGGLLPLRLPSLSGPGPVLTPAEMINNKTVVATIICSDTEASQLMMASGGKPWAVQVRTIGPNGAFGVFGHDPNTILGSVNAPGVLTVPACGHADMHLSEGQYLYARGSLPNTMVSISARMVE